MTEKIQYNEETRNSPLLVGNLYDLKKGETERRFRPPVVTLKPKRFRRIHRIQVRPPESMYRKGPRVAISPDLLIYFHQPPMT